MATRIFRLPRRQGLWQLVGQTCLLPPGRPEMAWQSHRHLQKCTGVFSAFHMATVLLSLRATLLDSLQKVSKL